jgi:hypothetical protein
MLDEAILSDQFEQNGRWRCFPARFFPFVQYSPSEGGAWLIRDLFGSRWRYREICECMIGGRRVMSDEELNGSWKKVNKRVDRNCFR